MPTQPKPKKPGRPKLPKGYARAETLRIRVTAADLKRYGVKAKDSKQTMSDWIRDTLNAASFGA